MLARFSYRFNLILLGVFLAANLLPPQALLVPIFRMYREIPLPAFMSETEQLLGQLLGPDRDQHRLPAGLLHVRAQQLHEDAAARALRGRPRSTAPACGGSTGSSPCRWSARPSRPWRPCRRPGSTTSSSGRPCCSAGNGDKFPITSALNNLRGQFFVDYNLLSAGSVLVALPVLLVFFVLQKQFVSGLTLGSTKG